MANPMLRGEGHVIRVLVDGVCPDTTAGNTYTLIRDTHGRLCFVDDVGDLNYGVSEDPEAANFDGLLDDPGMHELVI